ncbi:MAG: hypothetical protein CMQ05_01225 [Gammaproteobacteria bacterium]|nr:hypothetical protein [Gammaproteobacteria bacterium]
MAEEGEISVKPMKGAGSLSCPPGDGVDVLLKLCIKNRYEHFSAVTIIMRATKGHSLKTKDQRRERRVRGRT